MTQCNAMLDQTPGLTRLPGREVAVDFQGGRLATDAGLLLLREVDRRLDLIRRVDAAIPDPRDDRYTTHLQREMLTSRIFGIAAGYEDGNDHQQLRNDPAFQVAAERTPDGESPLASPSTLSRLENRVDSASMFRLHDVLVDTFLQSFAEPPDEIVLDMDATDDPLHGDQEHKHFNGFYNGYCFLPLYIFCGDQLLVSYLRSSRVGAAHHARPILKLLVAKIREHWPETRIIVRGDSGFADPKLLKWCDKNAVGYVFGFQKNKVLERLLKEETDQAQADFEASGTKQRRFAWFSYKTSRSWDRPRWIVGKAEHTEKGSNPRFVVTNLPELADGLAAQNDQELFPAVPPGAFYDDQYCPRGEMENRIKEQQLCLFADRTSCTDFLANQVRLLLSSFAYVLLDGIRRLALSKPALSQTPGASRWRVDTIRLRLIKIAARVTVSVRRVVFHLCSHCPYETEFRSVLRCLCDSG